MSRTKESRLALPCLISPRARPLKSTLPLTKHMRLLIRRTPPLINSTPLHNPSQPNSTRLLFSNTLRSNRHLKCTSTTTLLPPPRSSTSVMRFLGQRMGARRPPAHRFKGKGKCTRMDTRRCTASLRTLPRSKPSCIGG